MGLHQVIILDFGDGPEPQPNQQAAFEAIETRRPKTITCAYRDCRGGLHHVVPREVNGSRDPKQLLSAAIEGSRELASKDARMGAAAARRAATSAVSSRAEVMTAAHGLW